MSGLELGVDATSRKEHERRLPIHPDHFERIPESLRSRVHFEQGYGESFGIGDDEISRRFGPMAPREEILQHDIVLLPKPSDRDLSEMSVGGILWGWPHCVQSRALTQEAIDRKLTLLAWEAMYTWRGDHPAHHLFYKNNEMAGYCSVLHALELTGEDGNYGPARRSVVLSLGSVSRGAIYALQGRGYTDIDVYTQRLPVTIRDHIPDSRYGQMVRGEDGRMIAIASDRTRRPLSRVLAESHVIVNGILQNTDAPLMYLEEGEESLLSRGSIIVDVSCDDGMGFPFARPTSFEAPIFAAGGATYYAVDHSPSYLFRSATWEISEVVTEYLPRVMSGIAAWQEDPALRQAVEIERGIIKNPKILRFQGRDPEYPHA
jgi:alanine dehydrogenase